MAGSAWEWEQQISWSSQKMRKKLKATAAAEKAVTVLKERGAYSQCKKCLSFIAKTLDFNPEGAKTFLQGDWFNAETFFAAPPESVGCPVCTIETAVSNRAYKKMLAKK